METKWISKLDEGEENGGKNIKETFAKGMTVSIILKILVILSNCVFFYRITPSQPCCF